MTRKQRNTLLVTLMFFFVIFNVLADAPPDPGGGPGSGDGPVGGGSPIDGGLFILFSLGLTTAAKKFYRLLRGKNNPFK